MGEGGGGDGGLEEEERGLAAKAERKRGWRGRLRWGRRMTLCMSGMVSRAQGVAREKTCRAQGKARLVSVMCAHRKRSCGSACEVTCDVSAGRLSGVGDLQSWKKVDEAPPRLDWSSDVVYACRGSRLRGPVRKH